jgi:uncharacterized protein (DUF58 family)
MLFGFFLEAYMHNFNLVYITLFFVFGAAMSASPLGILNIGRLEVKIPALKTILIKLPAIPKKRGKLEIKECFLQSIFPLYTVRFILPLECEVTRTVYPRPVGISLEEHLAKRKATFGDEQDFDGIRYDEQVHNLARVHWPSVAKGESAIKVFDHELPHDTLHFDFLGAGESDEVRLSQLTLWTLECEQRSLDFEILLPQETLHSQRMEIDEILTKLALY